MKINDDIGRILEDIHYDPETGIFTRIKQTSNRVKVGDRAGWIFSGPKSPYVCRSIRVGGKKYLEHRLAWLIMTGDHPHGEIDHINQDATDNRWSNLRLSDHHSNLKNRTKQINNTSGVNGVYWCKKSEKWKAQVRIMKKHYHLGYFERDDLDIAAMAVMEFRDEHGFDPAHGIEFAKYHRAAAMAEESK